MKKSERIKAVVSLRATAEAAGVTWDRAKTNAARGDYWSPCPLHGEKTPSFHIVEKGAAGGFFKCFGCQASGSVIDFLMGLEGLDFTTAVRRLAADHGLEDVISEERKAELRASRDAAEAEAATDLAERAAKGLARARRIWRDATPDGAIIAAYLAARGVNLAAIGGVPASLRQVDDLRHYIPARRSPVLIGPAMVGVIGRDRLRGVHRTWITAEGRARYERGRSTPPSLFGTKVAKQWVGETGHIMGHPVTLSPPTSAVVVGEGIETSLAAFAGLLEGGKVGWSAEAALSRGAITGPVTDPAQFWTPRPGVAEVLVLGEGSSKDSRDAREKYEGARDRLLGLGLAVRLVVPHGRWDLDLDFADVAKAERNDA